MDYWHRVRADTRPACKSYRFSDCWQVMARMVTAILSKYSNQKLIPYHRIVYANGHVWLQPDIEVSRRRLYKKEGIKLNKNNRIVGFDEKVFSF